jgi:preprotein translocase subunit SecD
MDDFGYPCVGIELSDSRAPDFERITAANTGCRLGIVLAGALRSVPTLRTRLSRSMVIEGRFSAGEGEALSESIAEGRGPLRPLQTR